MPPRESSTTRWTAPPGPLRLRRLTLGLKQVEVAALAGLSREQLIRLEAGTSSPGWRTAQRLAAALDCNAEELFPITSEAPVPAAPNRSESDAEAADVLFETAPASRSAFDPWDGDRP